MATIDHAQNVLLRIVHAESDRQYHATFEYIMEQLGINQLEFEHASRCLLDKGLIIGVAGVAQSAPGLVRSTTSGKVFVEEGKTLRGELGTKPAGGMVNNFSFETDGGSVNQQIGYRNQQNITIGITSEDVANLVLALREKLAPKTLPEKVNEATNTGKELGIIGSALASIISVLTAAKELGTVATLIAGFL